MCFLAPLHAERNVLCLPCLACLSWLAVVKVHSSSLQVVNGNYVTAKRRGVVNGIDFGTSSPVRLHGLGCLDVAPAWLRCSRPALGSLQSQAVAPPSLLYPQLLRPTLCPL